MPLCSQCPKVELLPKRPDSDDMLWMIGSTIIKNTPMHTKEKSKMNLRRGCTTSAF